MKLGLFSNYNGVRTGAGTGAAASIMRAHARARAGGGTTLRSREDVRTEGMCCMHTGEGG